MSQTLQQAMNDNYGQVTITNYEAGGGPCLIVETSFKAWAFAVKDNTARLIRFVNKLKDPIVDIRNTIEPEDFNEYGPMPGVPASSIPIYRDDPTN